MTTHIDLVDRYITSWNEPDSSRRRALIAQTWTDGVSYLDPVMQGDGHAGIDAMISGVQAKFPGHRFRRVGEVDTHQDCIRFSWELIPESGLALAKGADFGIIAEDSRLVAVTGFFDLLPNQRQGGAG